MIVTTLEAIQQITYPHTTYLCDEANDPYLIELCKRLGVRHVTRNNRINAKAGNINNALKSATGEICVILDPDHVPFPNFLDPILPHFQDKEIGFVQIVQSYYNTRKTLVAKGAAEQTFQFYGPMMMSMNAYGTVNAIGANCTFRRSALDSIGGHAAGLSEDMHTAMLLHANGWKSIYVPQVLARGLAPESLTSFFKQQLKWSRGTFDLLFYVYPKLFLKFSTFQKIHYALLPLHYLVGVTYFISFLIPVLSLVLGKTPWSGHIIFFGILFLPMSVSAILIRAYIQKWVIEKKERGFHLMGGLLQIITWWVYFLGFVYTVVKKKIPYLPTPKGGEETTNLAITIPNMAIALISIFAIFYGLHKDVTPFSLTMACFALINTFFMLFSIYLSVRVTNSNNILRNSLEKKTVTFFVSYKNKYRKFSNVIFNFIRPVALPVILITALFAAYAIKEFNNNKWKNIETPQKKELTNNYLGIFYPDSYTGLSSLKKIDSLEKRGSTTFDLISLYLAWGDGHKHSFPKKLINAIYQRKSIPMITWEPWSNDFVMNDTLPVASKEMKIFSAITAGKYDFYIIKFAKEMASLEKPLFLRFAHEFDNPDYPWSATGNNSPQEFIDAWKHVHHLFHKLGATNVVWVWNPWKSEAINSYYPGDAYVDWVGITALNYGDLSQEKQWYDFKTLYTPFHEKLDQKIAKPVMITELGSLKQGGDQKKWMHDAIKTINQGYFKEIKATVVFNSRFDQNIPDPTHAQRTMLDWTTNHLNDMLANFEHDLPLYLLEKAIHLNNNVTDYPFTKKKFEHPLQGIHYKKALNWSSNHYVANSDELKKDFSLMRKTGVNCIRFEGLNMYDYNLLQYTQQFNLNVIYSFWTSSETNFIVDSEKLESQKVKILKTVKKYKNHPHIIAWNIGNVSRSLINNYNPPANTYQRNAYMTWLKELVLDIKRIDPNRIVSIDLLLEEATNQYINEIHEAHIPVDYFGLIVNDTAHLSKLENLVTTAGTPCYIADMDAASYMSSINKLKMASVVLRNWQDQWESNKISFDGLLDRKGREKVILKLIESQWMTTSTIAKNENIKILLPSRLLYENSQLVFRALVYENKAWKNAKDTNLEPHLEWSLIKNDPFGNPIAMKYLGKGSSISITIPADYGRYDLMLSLEKNKVITSIKSKLNTPLLAYHTNFR